MGCTGVGVGGLERWGTFQAFERDSVRRTKVKKRERARKGEGRGLQWISVRCRGHF